MIILKSLSLVSIIFIYCVFGLILHFLITFIQPNLRYWLISNLTKTVSIALRRLLSIKLCLKGNISYLKERGNFIISNHLSYLDGIILGSIFPVIFVSKLQVASWPFFGWMTRLGGTIFIDRKRRLKAKSFIEEIARMLKKGANILLFPEGTSTDGSKILTFQSVFFQSPLNSRAGIIPITIQYIKINSQKVSVLNRDRVCWYGQVEFSKHILEVLRLNDIEVEVIIHPKIKIDAYLNQAEGRKQLSEMARQVILEDFSFIRQD